ncbi:MAG: copper homeostasis protein CutC [Atopostipes suicloacalis]|nr:copper homeostasis protein CutC [Atopostipes suicloacalis]
MILEFAAENFTKIPEAIAEGVDRIELCDNLAVGGTTPSYAVIEHSLEYAKEHDVETAIILRPRGGNFVYSEDEFEIIKKEMIVAKLFEAEAVVFGSLTAEGRINRSQITELMSLKGSMETVFHMAFDFIPKENQKEELDWLVQQGFTRILTRGGQEGSAVDHVEWLQELIDYADNRIEIIVGGGVTHENYPELAKVLKTNQYHGTKIVAIDESEQA